MESRSDPPPPLYRLRGADLLVPDGFDDAAAAAGLPAGLYQVDAAVELSLPSGVGRIGVERGGSDEPPPEGWRRLPVRTALAAATVAGLDGSALLRACHLSHWLTESKFCGRCGAANAMAPDEFARLCPRCAKREYPRISPAAIVLIEDPAGRILLAHNAKFRPGMYSLIAGFVEAGETVEAAAVREAAEEVGLAIADLRYVASQPWPFPDSLMLGLRASCPGGRPQPDGAEILDAAWFEPDALPDIPTPGSVARRLIDLWRAERTGA
jgi:NAD+ diphosphatase